MAKQQYKIRNWRDYTQALVNRGSIILWFDEELIKQWYVTEKTEKRGRPKKYSDIAIQAALIIREIFRLPLRAEALLRCVALNKMTQLGMPISYAVT